MNAKNVLHKVSDEITATAKTMPFDNREFYVGWMAQHYHMVTHSMRMLELSAAMGKSDAEHDRWFNHLRGEVNHHKVLASDAKKLDVDVTKIEAFPEINAIVQSVYGGIINCGSHWLFGHALALEGFSCKGGGYILDLLVKTYGESKFMDLHVDADDGHDGHFDVGLRDVEKLSAEKQSEVIKAANITGALYCRTMLRLSEGLSSKARRAA